MPSPLRLPAVYAILDFDLTQARGFTPASVLDDWLAAGIQLVQFRAKTLTLGPFLEIAQMLKVRCDDAGATFLINDRIDVARLAGADGVHLGQDDLSPAEAREALPAGAIVGLSTHNDSQVGGALGSSASYIAIGPVFGTQSKANPSPPVGLDGVRRAASLAGAEKPVVAIGGISAATVASVVAAGADSVAVISALLDEPDPGAAARALLRAVT